MTDLHDDLADRLAGLGDALDLDDRRTVEAVLDRIRAPRSRGRGWLVAAAVAALVSAVVVLHPDSRHAVARWFGLDGVSIVVDPDLSLPPPPTSFELPGPGDSRVVVVDGRQILVSTVRGTLTDGLITKSVGSAEQVEEVDVQGRPGLWISGTPHEVLYRSPEGDVVVERVAANTLLWQDGTELIRVEGFADLAQALAFAEGT